LNTLLERKDYYTDEFMANAAKNLDGIKESLFRGEVDEDTGVFI